MNPHLKQLWAAMRLPENFKKSYKFFCRGLDIRVAKVVEANLRQARSIQHPMEHMEHAVRGNRPAGRARKYIAAAGLLLPLLLQNAYRIRPQRDGSVGILGFQRSLPHLAVDAPHLTAHPERLCGEINVLPLEAQQLASPETGCQLDVVHLEYAGVLGL